MIERIVHIDHGNWDLKITGDPKAQTVRIHHHAYLMTPREALQVSRAVAEVANEVFTA